MASRPTKASLLKSALKKTEKPFKYEDDFFDQFHKKGKVCTIPATNKKRKQNVFLGMRPKPGIYADYNISQTDIKMDAGDTKIHLERTVAEYIPPPPGVEVPPPPPPPKRKRLKYFHGGPPVWEFMDEIRNKKIEKLQEFYKERLVKVIRNNKTTGRTKRLSLHNYLLALAGPEWYQELSPRQINCVNQLKECIIKDLATKTTINCYENLAYLGLVPRPKRRLIRTAMQICCACPVEFLLILYQMINPKRKSYSINDRIMLSAVVHLTMTETLRELHIRIPSPPPPPPPPKPVKKVKPKEKKKTYESPYLIPFTFKPKPPKHTGVYKDNHRQYPESPYFSYIAELKRQSACDKENDGCTTSIEYGQVDYDNEEVNIDESNKQFERAAEASINTSIEVNVSDDSILKAEEEIAKELVVAQREYNKLTTLRQVPRLQKPSVYIPCKQAKMFEREEELEMEIRGEEIKQPSQHDVNVAVEFRVTSKYDEDSGKIIQNICECTVKFKDKRLQEEPPTIEEIMPVRDGCTNETCDKLVGEEEVDVKSLDQEINLPELPKIDAGKNITITKSSKPQCKKCKYAVKKKLKTSRSCDCKKCNKLKGQKPSPPFIIAGLKQDENEGTVPIIQGVKDQACDCMTIYEDKVRRYEDYKARHDLVEEMSDLAQKFIVGGVCMGPRGKPTFTILGVKPECKCLQTVEEPPPPPPSSLLELKEAASSRCVCKPEVQGVIDTAVCRCDKCMELARARFKANAIIAGHREAEGEAPERIIAGIKEHKECDCLRRYREAVEKYESWKNRSRVIEELSSAEQKFAISGVVSRPNQPPVFIISGVEPKRECPCVQRMKDELAERERLKNMPKKLLGLRYVISGVKETPEGNVYIVSGVQDGEKCRCLQLYDSFMKKHKKCLKISEIYDEKVKEDVEEYVNEVAEDENCCVEGDDDEDGQMCGVNGPICEYRCIDIEKDDGGVNDSTPVCGEKCLAPRQSSCTQEEPEPVQIQEMDTSLTIKLEYNPKKSDEACICSEQKTEEEEKKMQDEVGLKRFIILDQFPKDEKTQYEILKKALAVMAEDGYPLAKLPDCHKLPHFKLWLQLRSGMSWSLEDKYDFIKTQNKPAWNHTDICFRRVSPDKMIDIDPTKFRYFSYANAIGVKRMVGKKRGRFYRALRQSAIDDAREFIPTMNLYEFPFPTFRDCLFAYLPGKEEEVFSFRPWLPHEFKNMQR